MNIEARVRVILNDVEGYPETNSDKPFLTAYQIAIEFNRRFKDEADEIGFQVGGKDIGERNSLAQYLAGQLSQRIVSGELEDIEVAFISNDNLSEISFTNYCEPLIVSSLTSTPYPLSMFRLRM